MEEFDCVYARLQPLIRGLCRGSLMMKRIVVSGGNNFVRTGGNIIIANHIGSYKDIAVLLRVVPRRIYFTANARIFSRTSFQDLVNAHLRRSLNAFGPALDLALTPLKRWFIRTISDNIARIGTIPVDLDLGRSRAFGLCREYLLQARAVIALQGMGFVSEGPGHPYVPPFRRGPAALSYAVYEQAGLAVPVTPTAIFGAHLPWAVPSAIRVHVGEPMSIADDLRGGRSEIIHRFRDRLETRVKQLVGEALRGGPRG